MALALALVRSVIGTPLADPSRPGVEIKPAADGSLPLRAFKLRHRCYADGYWARLRALYRGGQELLGDLELLAQILPRNNAEKDEAYRARLAAAFYANYSSEIVGFVMAGLCQDPIRAVVGEGGAGTPAGKLAEFVKDTANNADEPIDLGTLARDVILEALQVRTAWVELRGPDMPPPEELEQLSQAELEDRQRAAGRDRAEVRCLPAESVINWSDDAKGELVWALVQSVEEVRDDFWSAPLRRYTWTLHTRVDSTTWSILVNPAAPPQDETLIAPLSKAEPHGFDRVPLLRFTLPHDLWAMDKLESLAREHTDKRNDLGRSVKRSATPMLYEFMGAETPGIRQPISIHGQDPNRAVNTPRSPGHVQQRGDKDRAEWIAPPPDAYAAMLAYCQDVRDDMHRVMVQMALAADFKSAAAVGRSGESKKQDRAATAVVLGAIGKRFRPWATKLLRVVAGAEADALQPQVQGMAKFDETVASEVVEQAQMLEGVTLPSQTAKAELGMRLVRALLDNLSEETMRTIRKELEVGHNPEEMLRQQVEAATAMAVAGAAAGDDGEDDEADDGEDDAPPPKAKGAKGPVVDTSAAPRRRGK